MRRIAEALFACEGTRARTAKVAALASALRDVSAQSASSLPFATRFASGVLLPVDDGRTLGVGFALLVDAAAQVTGRTPAWVSARARATGDLGTALGEAVSTALEEERLPGTGLRLGDAEEMALALAATGSRDAKLAALVDAFAATTALEARYLARAVLGEMRVGAKEGIVVDAVAAAFDRPADQVRRAAGIVADVGVLAELARGDRLAAAAVTLGRPLGFMLATPLETAKGLDLAVPHAVEDKIDGVRAQVHVRAGGTVIFARGKGAVTAAFPDVAGPLTERAAGGELAEAILDGEIVVVTDEGRPRPFSAIQPRLKKNEPDLDLVREHPVVLLVYDLVWEAGESLLDRPFRERRERLEAWCAAAPPNVRLHASTPLTAPESVDPLFEDARRRGWEGLVLKRLDAPYAAGVRGFAWIKVKKAFATLDVVVVAAERGQGRRHEVFSDYTFAVRDDDGVLLPVGKAYSGLTDVEIKEMTERLLALATGEERHGRLPVRPEIVLEVAFDGIQRSDRHASGYALRFPRIARIRDDKRASEVSGIADVRALYEAQLASGHREDETAAGRQPARGGRKSGRKPDVRAKSKQLKLFDD